MPAQQQDIEDGIAIIGMAGRFPGADNVSELWDGLLRGFEGVTVFRPDEIHERDRQLAEKPGYVLAKGVVKDSFCFDAEFFGITPMEATLMDPQQRLLIELTWQLFEDAGYIADEIEARVGAFVGTNWGHYKARYLASSANQDKVQRFGELNTAIANEQDFPATRLAYLFNFRGPCINLLTACSTGLVGVCQGVNSLLNFESDYVVAGGVSLDPPSNRGYLYNEGGMLSKDGYTRPFDSEASGTTFNEGGALVLLKRLEDAVADKDTIHAVILGCATNNDGNKKVSFTAPSVDGQSDALKLALTVSDVDPGAVTHIETHGTATPLGDPIEVAAIKSAYGKEDAPPCYLGSLKGNVGHMIHAAGTGSLIKMALSLRDGVIPPVAHFKSANPNLKLERSRFSVNPEPVRWHDNEADALFGAVSSFGVGGTNAHAVLRSWNDDRPSDADTAVPVALISADSEESLHTLAGRLAESVDPADWPDAAYTLLKGRKRLAHRGSLALPEKGADGPASGTMLLAGAAKAVSEVVFLFPGQGAQWPGMAAGLKEGLPEVARDVERCIDATGPLKESLRYLLFEADPQDSEAAEQLRQTSLTQPALFAMSYAVGRYWLRRGVVPSKMIGHSVGEFAAACLAGVWDLETTVAAVCRRAQLMQNAAPGAMLAVRLGVSELDPLLKDSGLALAVVNGPESAVVGGDDASVEAFSASLKRQGIASQRLVTSHAFHTASMSDAAEAFLEYLNGVSFDEPQYTIISTATGKTLTADQIRSSQYWSDQLRNPVQFAAAVTLASSGDSACLFLEVGPGKTLSTLCRTQVDKHHQTAASLPAQKPPRDGIANAWAALWLSGISLDAEAVYGGENRRRIPLPGYPFRKTRFCVDEPSAKPSEPEPQSAPKIMEEATGGPQVLTTPEQSSTETLKTALRELMSEYAGSSIEAEDDELSFLELGLDSLLLTQISQTISSEYQVDVSFRDLSERLSTMNSLTDWLVEQKPELATPVQPPPAMNEVAASSLDVSLPALGSTTSGDPVDDLIQQQLKIMQMQLQVLSGQEVAPAAAHVTPPNAETSSLVETAPASDEVAAKVATARSRGPGVRISRKNQPVTEQQQTAISEFIRRYTEKTSKSKSFAQRHRSHLADPRTVSGFNPLWKEMVYPIVTDRSSGALLCDTDGNEYLDLTNGFGQILFGHSPEFVTEAVKRQIDMGVEIGPQTELAGEVAELLCEITGSERMAFANTGSEAVLAAVRLARTVTNRNRVVSFEHAYHGIFDEVIVRGGRGGKALPGAPGIPRSVGENVSVLPWADMDMIDVIRAQADDIAAVMVEPVQSRAPDIQPVEFLRALREVTEEQGIALIFDEVVTGFRCAPGGAQAFFDIRADLATYGKILGGGYPIGALAGKSRFMDALDGGQWQFGDSSSPEVGVTFFAGTFVRHPLAMAASQAVLQRLKQEGPELQAGLNATTKDFCTRLNQVMESLGVTVRAQFFSSVFYFDLDHQFAEVWFALLRLHGIHIWSNRPCFLTLSHTAEHLQQMLASFEAATREMIDYGLLETTVEQGAETTKSPSDSDSSTSLGNTAPTIGPIQKLG